MGSMGATRGGFNGFDREGSKGDAKSRGRGGIIDSPLAAQLQQAWLQTQLPKRNLPKLDFLSPLPSPEYSSTRNNSSSSLLSHPSSSSVSVSPGVTSTSDSLRDGLVTHSEVDSYSPPDELDTGASSEMIVDEPLLSYISDMLMEEDLYEQKCMFTECSAYHAMTKELAELIGDNGHGSRPDPFDDEGYWGPAEDDSVNSWVDDVLSGPASELFVDEPAHIPKEVPAAETSGSDSPPVSEVTQIGLGSDCPLLDPCNDLPSSRALSGGADEPKDITQSFTTLVPLLVQCAQAVTSDDLAVAHGLLSELRRRSSPKGDGAQRMTYYFVEALVARISGTGASLYTALSNNRPSAVEMLKAYRAFIDGSPLPKISHVYANMTILEAIKDSSRVHIIDFGILYGVQWPCFIWHLSQRAGGPPFLRITGVDLPQPGFKPAERIEETGRRLAGYAKNYGVEFEYHAIACKWENFQASQFVLEEDETLIVNCMFRLRNLLDETVMASSPRKIFLSKIWNLNPKSFVMGVISAGYNAPFFMSRFREAISHYTALFESIYFANPEADMRRLVEQEILGREILNIVACEGTERVERAETFRQWHSKTVNAGFKQQPLSLVIVDKVREILMKYNKNFGFALDGEWLISGWKDRVLHAMTSWRP